MNEDVGKYFDSAPDERRAKLDVLHKLIIGLYPHTSVDLEYRMPTYHCGDGWVAIANQKNYVSLYTFGAHHLEVFKLRHPRIKTGKGCINFKPGDEIPLADVEHVVTHAMDHPKGE